MKLTRGTLDRMMYEYAKGIKAGGVRPALFNQDRKFVMWLIDQVPDGGTIAEVLVAMALDTYEQEKSNET